jgi:hypothetical protein
MDAWVVILVVVAVIALAALAWWAMSRRRTADLQQKFGPEYDRTVQASDNDRRTAESELAARRERREQLNIRELDPASRGRYETRWTEVQARFVDEPALAVREADELVLLVMRERGYPMDDFDQRAADISVDHPQVVEHYRAGHDISSRQDASTEDLRQAFVHYRALFGELLGRPDEAVPPMPREAAR